MSQKKLLLPVLTEAEKAACANLAAQLRPSPELLRRLEWQAEQQRYYRRELDTAAKALAKRVVQDGEGYTLALAAVTDEYELVDEELEEYLKASALWALAGQGHGGIWSSGR